MLKMRPEGDQVRIVFTDAPASASLVRENPGAVFAVIGPFEGFDKKRELQEAIVMLLRGYNVTTK